MGTVFALHLSGRLLLYFGTPGLRLIGQTINFLPGPAAGPRGPRPFLIQKLENYSMSGRILKTSVSIAAITASLAFLFAFAWGGLSIHGH
jgi:hypothetical protein